jgi:hypothetical protein
VPAPPYTGVRRGRMMPIPDGDFSLYYVYTFLLCSDISGVVRLLFILPRQEGKVVKPETGSTGRQNPGRRNLEKSQHRFL